MVKAELVPMDRVEKIILVLRGHRVILDTDLAEIYVVPAKRLNEQVKRNLERFPADFMFQLSSQEYSNLKSQSATSSSNPINAGRAGALTRRTAAPEGGRALKAVMSDEQRGSRAAGCPVTRSRLKNNSKPIKPPMNADERR